MQWDLCKEIDFQICSNNMMWIVKYLNDNKPKTCDWLDEEIGDSMSDVSSMVTCNDTSYDELPIPALNDLKSALLTTQPPRGSQQAQVKLE